MTKIKARPPATGPSKHQQMTNPNNPIVKDKHLGYEALALTVALIWGTTFIAQKTAMDTIGPWLYVGMRFSLAVPVLMIMVWVFERDWIIKHWRQAIVYSIVPGSILAAASMLQQVALLDSYASKAGLITCMYVCILPFMSAFFGYRLKLREIAAAFMALTGLYFLSVTGALSISFGDTLLIISAFGWAIHIMALELCLRRVKPFSLALCQTAICSLLVDVSIPFVEMDGLIALSNNFASIMSDVWFEIVYGGIMSVGFGFCMQVVCQQHVSPNRVALIFSMESLFAVVFSWLILSETFNQRELFGAALMLASLIVVRVQWQRAANTSK